MDEKKATVGKTVAGSAVSTNGAGAHPHHNTQLPPVILPKQARDLLAMLWQEGEWAYIWTPNTGRFYVDKKTGERKEAKESLWFPVDRMPQIPAGWAGRNVYFGVYPSTVQREPWQRVLNSTVAAMSCFFAEFDVKDYGSKEAILAHLHTLPLYPSVIVDSGGGYHCYWLLARPVVIDDVNRTYMRRLLYAWIDLVGSDDGAKDMARVLRLPGSLNLKPAYGPNFPQVQFVECNLERTYPLEQIEELAGHLVGAQQEHDEYEGHTSRLDDMAAAADALQRLGSHRNKYGEWIKVGMALKAGLGEAGLSLWREWSAGNSNYEPGKCEEKWATFEPSDLTLGTLIWMADQDAPREKKQRKSQQKQQPGGQGEPEAPAAASEEDAEQAAAQAERALLYEGAHDEGNAQVTHLRYKGRFCHNDSFGWLQHAGSHWTTGGAEAATERAITETLLARIDAALRSGEADKHGDLIKRCIPSSARVQGAKAQLKSLVYVGPEHFDADPNLLNCPNGVVDLRTGKITPHSPEQRFTHCTSVGYEPDADQSLWLEWLTGAAGKEQADWLQLAVGYSLTGSTAEEVLFYIYGPPRSGKGIFSETMLAVMGKPLATEINFGTFTATRTGDSQNFDLAPLKPCRLVAASESNSYERFNEAKLKALTGGNEIWCAFKYGAHFGYRPQFKIWLSSNEPVNGDPDDEAMWGRLRVIEFPHSHLGSEDKTLKQRMRSPEVLKGVLAWAIEGASKWYRLGAGGLPELPSSSTLKQQQREQLDAVAMWLEECCLQSMADSFTPGHELYSSYKLWCEINGQTPKQMKGLSQALKRKGFADGRQWVDGKLKRGFSGVKIL